MHDNAKNKASSTIEGKSCFIADCLCDDTIVHLGPNTMGTKDLEQEMIAGTPLGMKLREVAKKVKSL